MIESYLTKVKPVSKSSGYVYLSKKTMLMLGGMVDYLIVEATEEGVILRRVPEYARVVKLRGIEPFLEVDEESAEGRKLSGWMKCPSCRKYYKYLEVKICPYCDTELEVEAG
jgi:uncharacterized protein YbaR (Trm112 family)